MRCSTWGMLSLWGWRSAGAGCPGRLWSLLLWRYSRPAWTRSCAACSGWPCFSRGVGLDDPQRALPTPTILWFCDTDLSQGKRKGTGHTAILSQYNLPVSNDPQIRRFKSQSQKSLNTFVLLGLALALKQGWCRHDWEHSSARKAGSHPKFMTQPTSHNQQKKRICPSQKSPRHHSAWKAERQRFTEGYCSFTMHYLSWDCNFPRHLL